MNTALVADFECNGSCIGQMLKSLARLTNKRVGMQIAVGASDASLELAAATKLSAAIDATTADFSVGVVVCPVNKWPF